MCVCVGGVYICFICVYLYQQIIHLNTQSLARCVYAKLTSQTNTISLKKILLETLTYMRYTGSVDKQVLIIKLQGFTGFNMLNFV